MKMFGLIGFPLTHSFSQKYFREKFEREKIKDCRYINFPIEDIGHLMEIIEKNNSLCGLNVTIPHKQKVISILDEVDEVAGKIGAVNTIKIHRTGKKIHLKGFNTDAHGFLHSLKPFLKNHHRNALILGTGGSSRAVAHVLKELGICFLYASRNPGNEIQLGYNQLDNVLMNKTQIIINSSPVGMFPNTNSCPDIPYEFITSEHILFDLIYNPEETLFLKKGKEKDAQTINGLTMLHLQAEKSWEIWNDENQ